MMRTDATADSRTILRFVKAALGRPYEMEFSLPDGGRVTLLAYSRDDFDRLCEDGREPRPAYPLGPFVVTLMPSGDAAAYLPACRAADTQLRSGR